MGVCSRLRLSAVGHGCETDPNCSLTGALLQLVLQSPTHPFPAVLSPALPSLPRRQYVCSQETGHREAPTDAADGGHGAELVDDVARQEVDVVVGETDARVAHAVPPQLVQLGVLHPVDGLEAGD